MDQRAIGAWTRRRFITAAGAAFAAAGLSGRALAADPIRIVVGTDPGGSLDATARAFAQELRQALGVTVEVENDGGGGGRFALSAAHAARGNPNFISFVSGSMVYGALAEDDLAAQFAEVGFLGSMGRDQRVLYVATSTGITSFEQVLASTERLTLATPRATSSSHLETLLTNAVTGSRIVPVGGFGSAGRKVALLSGEVQAAMGSFDTFSDMVADGTLTPILALNRPVAGSPLEGLPLLESFADSDAKRRLVEIIATAAESDQMLVLPPDLPEGAFARLESAFLAAAPKVTETLRAVSGGGATLPNDTGRLREAMTAIFAGRALYGETLKAALACGTTLSEGGACTL